MTSTDPGGVARLQWRGAVPPSPTTVARRLRAEGVEPHAWSNRPGDRYGAHDHGYEKVLMCAAGSILFRVGPDELPIELRAGDGVILPPGTRHSAEVGPDGVTCLEGSR